MYKNARNLFITIFLFLFATQAVLACVCEVNSIEVTSHASMGHDNLNTSNAHHDENYDCDDRCHLSFIELDSGDFIKSYYQHFNSFKQDLITLDKELNYLHLNDQLISALDKVPTFPKYLKPNSLQSQKVLLQI